MILIKGRCENCQRIYIKGFKDKVNNKIVCVKCKKQAIDFGIRFNSDFQEERDNSMIEGRRYEG